MASGRGEDFPESCIREVIRKSIERGTLFELLFTEHGQKLWKPTWTKEKMRKFIDEELKRLSKRPNRRRR